MIKKLKLHLKNTKFTVRDLFILLFIIFWYSFFGCPLKYFFGISCAGCGMTRALTAVLNGKFADAWHFHPLIYVMPVIAAAFLLRNRFSKSARQILLAAVCLLFTVTYVIRLCNGNDTVAFEFQNSAVYSLFNLFLGE